ncbi:hypothetical protein IAU59_000986 [Kwoniella sp. CBS 9459]
MRASTFLLALGLIGTSLAAPTPLAQPQPAPVPVSPILFAKDPLAIHKRADVPDVPAPAVDADVVTSASASAEAEKEVVEVEVEIEDDAASSASVESAVPVPTIAAESSTSSSSPSPSAVVQPEVETESETQAETDKEEPCVSICGVQRVEGAKSEREALCSVIGLQATLACAKCIDETWPETTWEDSAMAEYERIVSACDDSPQTAFRRNQ